MSKVYKYIAEKFINFIKTHGYLPWQKPWQIVSAKNALTAYEYKGINKLLLSLQHYKQPYYVTAKQAFKIGGKIRAGATAHMVVYYYKYNAILVEGKRYKIISNPEEYEEDSLITIPVLRYYNVFNIEDITGIDWSRYVKTSTETPASIPMIDACEKIILGYNNRPQIIYGGNIAAYSPQKDVIYIPNKQRFHSAEEYYNTLFHELIHSTGHSSRLNRNLCGINKEYSREELIAEIGAAILCSDCGIDTTFKNSAAYISGWVRVLEDHAREIVYAASRAEKAVAFIKGVTAIDNNNEEEEEVEEEEVMV